MIILDSNVLSELMRPRPDKSVVEWLARHTNDELSTTSVTIGEIWYGIERLPDGRRKAQIAEAAERATGALRDRILPFDTAAARLYASLVARRDRSGHPISGFDGQIAAICRVRDASLATRNVKDFAETGVEIINPWQSL